METVKCDEQEENSKSHLKAESVNVQMKCSDTGMQSEFISGDHEMKPASVLPHRKRFCIISAVSLIIMPNRRFCGHGTIRPSGCPHIFWRWQAGEKGPVVKTAR